jgi:hypothetical protein
MALSTSNATSESCRPPSEAFTDSAGPRRSTDVAKGNSGHAYPFISKANLRKHSSLRSVGALIALLRWGRGVIACIIRSGGRFQERVAVERGSVRISHYSGTRLQTQCRLRAEGLIVERRNLSDDACQRVFLQSGRRKFEVAYALSAGDRAQFANWLVNALRESGARFCVMANGLKNSASPVEVAPDAAERRVRGAEDAATVRSEAVAEISGGRLILGRLQDDAPKNSRPSSDDGSPQ